MPAHLINPVITETFTKVMCPVCALKALNEHHGTNFSGFEGRVAQRWLEEAQKYYKETRQ